MTRKILEPWFYDCLLNQAYERLAKTTKENLASQFEASMVMAEKMTGCKIPNKTITDADVQRRREGIKESIRELHELHVVLVGPATLESLVNQDPERYDYIKDGKLPFNELFFEFKEPIRLPVPFMNLEKNIRGLELRKEIIVGNPGYAAALYYADGNNDTIRLSVTFRRSREGFFSGSMYNDAESAGMPIIFTIDLKNQTIRYNDKKDMGDFAARAFQAQQKFNPLFKKSPRESVREIIQGGYASDVVYPNIARIGDFQYGRVFFQIPNLCINLVNYVNAHNVTIIRKERKIIYVDEDEHRKSEPKSDKKPYHLVTIKEGFMRSLMSRKKSGIGH